MRDMAYTFVSPPGRFSMDKSGEYLALWYVCMPNISCANGSCYQATSLFMALATKISPPAELQTGKAVVA